MWQCRRQEVAGVDISHDLYRCGIETSFVDVTATTPGGFSLQFGWAEVPQRDVPVEQIKYGGDGNRGRQVLSWVIRYRHRVPERLPKKRPGRFATTALELHKAKNHAGSFGVTRSRLEEFLHGSTDAVNKCQVQF